MRSPEDAEGVLAYFNYFHDSFLERLTLTVVPAIGEEFGFGGTATYAVDICLVHTNYEGAWPSQGRSSDGHERRVELALSNVESVAIGNLMASDDMLQECLIEVESPRRIRLDIGGDGLFQVTCQELMISEVRRIRTIPPTA